uniref:Uncharacterized protein n=1 Tax=Psilocybe cubensis TaxID=181762 RepID=A0A8H7XNG9_PSICU
MPSLLPTAALGYESEESGTHDNIEISSAISENSSAVAREECDGAPARDGAQNAIADSQSISEEGSIFLHIGSSISETSSLG